MSLFNRPSRQKQTGKIQEHSAESPKPDDGIPVSVIDLSKRYDIYCYLPGEYRLYENVRIVGIKTFESPKHKFGTSVIGGYTRSRGREWRADDDTVSPYSNDL